MSNEDDSIIIDLSRARSKGNSKRYYCSYCNTRLTPLTREDMIGAYLCTKCTITYWPRQTPVKKANRFETPGPDTNEHGDVVGDKTIPVTTMDVQQLSSTSYTHIDIPKAYRAMKGYTWTSFEER
jgi:hypothetical protein